MAVLACALDASAPGMVQASITTRKGGKRLAIWDLNFTLEWAAMDTESDKQVRSREELLPPGVVEVPFVVAAVVVTVWQW